MEVLSFLFLFTVAIGMAIGAYRWRHGRNTEQDLNPDDVPTQELTPLERAAYYKSRTDIPVDSAGVYEGDDEENIAAVVRAAFLTGGMVVGNINEDGDLELTVHDPKD